MVFSDGAKAYAAVIKELFRGKLINREVSHKKMQFVKKVRTPMGHSSLAGTESVDSVWGQLQKAIPHSVNTKKDRQLNPLIEEYTWSWLYRQNRSNGDGMKLLGDVFQ